MSKFLFLKRACLLVILFQVAGNLVRAQQPYYNQRPEFLKANSVWAFGQKAGLDFNSGTPQLIPTEMFAYEGCASVADPVTGKLLFYSNGGDVWNANHEIMPNGDSLLGNVSSTSSRLRKMSYSTSQGVCIVPVIGELDKYYLFSMTGMSSATSASSQSYTSDGTLFYNIIDMNLDGGLGDVIPGKKNIVLDYDTLSEAMIAVPGDNCNEIWLVVYSIESYEFKAYHITESGINTAPVISKAAALWFGNPVGTYAMGSNMAISPDRTKIALSSGFYSTSAGGSLMGEFNPATGQVSNAFVFDELLFAYGICFSPDNSKLYISNFAGTLETTQFDLSVYDSTIIRTSGTIILGPGRIPGHLSSFRLYNDTIYQLYTGSKYLNRINSPNLLGAACDYSENVLQTLLPDEPGFTLGNDVVFPYPPDTTYALAFDSMVCEAASFTINALSGFNDYEWDDGSVASSRHINSPGVYWVLCKDNCHSRIDTFIISGMDLVRPVINVDKRKLGTAASYESYQWMLNGNIIFNATDSTYTVQENGAYQVIVSSRGGCVDTSDVYNVTNADEPNHMQGVDALSMQIRVFPNPTGDNIYISAPIEVDAKIYSMDGRVLKNIERAQQINVRELSTGLYFIKIYDLNGLLLKYEKIIIN